MNSDFEAITQLEERGIKEIKAGILVGPKDLNDLDTVGYNLVKYLFDEWDYIYLSEYKYKDLTNT